MLDVSYNWIYKIPCIGSVIANFFFLVAIVIILVSKLHTDVSDRAAMIKTAKAIGELQTESRHLVQYFVYTSDSGLTKLSLNTQVTYMVSEEFQFNQII